MGRPYIAAIITIAAAAAAAAAALLRYLNLSAGTTRTAGHGGQAATARVTAFITRRRSARWSPAARAGRPKAPGPRTPGLTAPFTHRNRLARLRDGRWPARPGPAHVASLGLPPNLAAFPHTGTQRRLGAGEGNAARRRARPRR